MKCAKFMLTCRRKFNSASSSSIPSLSVAPMMEYTNHHFRAFMRIITKETVLYTEMVAANTVVHRPDTSHLTANFEVENPVVLQLGGSDPEVMHRAATIAYDYGYREMNLNVGCPSEKVSGKGSFGAVLMNDPALVSELTLAIKEASNSINATVKCRIGVDNNDSYEALCNFVSIISERGKVTHFIIHARKAILGLLSPKENRTIPPLQYDTVFRLAKDFPSLQFTLNGGVRTINEAKKLLNTINDNGKPLIAGVMLGRAAIDDPFQFRQADHLIYGNQASNNYISRREIILKYADYCQQAESQYPHSRYTLMKPITNIVSGEKNGKLFRKLISNNIQDQTQSVKSVLLNASLCLSDEILDSKC